MEEEEAVKIFDLVVKGKMLPATLDKLVPLIFVGEAAKQFYGVKVAALAKLAKVALVNGDHKQWEMLEQQRKATLGDGQDTGDMLIDLEKLLGEMYESMPSEAGQRPQNGQHRGKQADIKSLGIGQPRASAAVLIAKNPEAVKAVREEARRNEDIPTKTAVLNRINYEKEKARREKAEANGRTPDKAVVALDVMEYLNALERVVSILPQKPPKNWSESSLAKAKGYAKIITKRLEVFS